MDAAGQLSFEHEAFPSAVRPMQAVSAEAPFSADDYIFEVKWDGLRALAFVEPDGSVHLHDRGLHDITNSVPEMQALAAQVPPGTVLDGELVATDPDGRPDYQALRERLAAQPGPETPLAYLAFDLLYLEGKSQLRQRLMRRKARLRKAVDSGGVLFVPDHIAREGVELFEACLERGLEGVMAKHVESTYVPGQRSPFWLKVKAVKSDDFVVTGWTPGQPFGALLVGYYERGRLLPCGAVSGGYDSEAYAALGDQLAELATAECPLEPPPVVTAPVLWVRPELVISVRYSEWSVDGTLRFPIFNGLRSEVHPAECVRHRPRVVIGGHAPPDSPVHGLTRFPF
ncbi:MAG: non-homologous end-joining DNA ligase [Chloroflexota bacterium]